MTTGFLNASELTSYIDAANIDYENSHVYVEKGVAKIIFEISIFGITNILVCQHTGYPIEISLEAPNEKNKIPPTAFVTNI